ncbi:MAG: hypothetical protein CMF74_00730 [Maricaulis sp.]|nr:hypothetical protein [Maricaulis sp.]HAQ35314.1 hypothetical protein [Alphaproteobacteria bacterium]
MGQRKALPRAKGGHVNRFTRRRPQLKGRVAAIASDRLNADDLMNATRPLERAGFGVAVVTGGETMLTARSERADDVQLMAASTIGDMDFDRYCALILPGGVNEITDSARLVADRFLAAGKPIIAMSDGVALLAAAANAPEAADAPAAISMRGQVFAARGETAIEDATELFAEGLVA